MPSGKKTMVAQLVLGRAELERFTLRQVTDRLVAARAAIGLDRLLYWPSGDMAADRAVLDRCAAEGIEAFLWQPVLADAGGDPEAGERTLTAWGDVGHGGAGRWESLNRAHGGETFVFACPGAARHGERVSGLCRDRLPEYAGLFLDRIRFPSPANGLEALFTCFCPRCAERNPEMGLWREGAREFRRFIAASDDRALERMGTLEDGFRGFGLAGFMEYRFRSVAEVVKRFAMLAAERGKTVGLDLFSPAVARLVGQDYRVLVPSAAWIKPMSYCHVPGPAGLPLELSCLARGLLEWGPKLTDRAVLDFVGRSAGLDLSAAASPAALLRDGLDEANAGLEADRAVRLLGGAGCAVLPGFECVRHPDFQYETREEWVESYLAALSGQAGAVLSWNILYIPDAFLRLTAGRLLGTTP